MKKKFLAIISLISLGSLVAEEQLYTKILNYGQSAAQSIKPVAQQGFNTAQTFVTNNPTLTAIGIFAGAIGLNGIRAQRKYNSDMRHYNSEIDQYNSAYSSAMDQYSSAKESHFANHRKLNDNFKEQFEIQNRASRLEEGYSKLKFNLDGQTFSYDNLPRGTKTAFDTKKQAAENYHNSRDLKGLSQLKQELDSQYSVALADPEIKVNSELYKLHAEYCQLLIDDMTNETHYNDITSKPLLRRPQKPTLQKPQKPAYPIRQVAAGVIAPTTIACYGLFKFWDKLPRFLS